jgi:hypothetical protein
LLRFPWDFVSLRVRERNDSVITVMIEEHRRTVGCFPAPMRAIAINHF